MKHSLVGQDAHFSLICGLKTDSKTALEPMMYQEYSLDKSADLESDIQPTKICFKNALNTVVELALWLGWLCGDPPGTGLGLRKGDPWTTDKMAPFCTGETVDSTSPISAVTICLNKLNPWRSIHSSDCKTMSQDH